MWVSKRGQEISACPRNLVKSGMRLAGAIIYRIEGFEIEIYGPKRTICTFTGCYWQVLPGLPLPAAPLALPTFPRALRARNEFVHHPRIIESHRRPGRRHPPELWRPRG